MDEPFGPEYVLPAQLDCPRCGCCTEVLCEKGRNSLLRCQGHVDDAHRETVYGCPCSAETTKHTASWRMAQVRVTLMAREQPLAPTAVALLRALAAGGAVEDTEGAFPQLKIRGLAQLVHLLPSITPLGRTYLAACEDVRETTSVRVLSVDTKTRTAQVEVAAWRPGEPVTVLLDQVASDSGLDVASLPDQWLTAVANCPAENADRLVLTGFRSSAELPQVCLAVSGGGVE